MFSSVTSKWRAAAVLLALSVGAAACGSTDTTAAPEAQSSEATAADTADASNDAGAAAPSPDASSGDESTADESGAEQGDASAEAPAAPVANLFPDADVLNIADGSTVNLAAELGGADKATLLWFFAPH